MCKTEFPCGFSCEFLRTKKRTLAVTKTTCCKGKNENRASKAIKGIVNLLTYTRINMYILSKQNWALRYDNKRIVL